MNLRQSQLLALPLGVKVFLAMLFDSGLLVIALLASFSMRLGEWYWPEGDLIMLIFGAPILAIPVFTKFGLYRAIIRYIGFRVLWTIVQAVSLYALIWGVVVLLFGLEWFPRSVTLVNWVLVMLLVGGSRMVGRWWVSGLLSPPLLTVDSKVHTKRVVIYGAGEAGVQLANALLFSRELHLTAFLDDSPSLQGRKVNAITVYSLDYLDELIEQKRVDEVLLAIPSVSRVRRHQIIEQLDQFPVVVRMLPGIAEMAQGRVAIEDLRKVSVEDLLERDQVPPNHELLHANIQGKVVMVTGAGGSIGSALCRQIIQNHPKLLIMFEQSEYSLYLIEKELRNLLDSQADEILVPVLGSVVNQERVRRVCNTFKVSTIYHAAAYKHVPMVELNNQEGIENNLFGTLACAQAAIESAVETFVLISSDKAVRPTNTMGATKRMAEMVLQAKAIEVVEGGNMPHFIAVRFGNVLGSSGSVIPLFKKQIEQGGPVTVTDSEVIRYFMTISEAAELVIQAGAMGKGGDVFVMDMGEPVKIIDLARKMIHLSGLEVKDGDHPDGDIEIQIIGLRPGEKLYEELLIGDNVLSTDHSMIMRAEEEKIPWIELQSILVDLESAVLNGDFEKMRSIMMKAVPGFVPQCEIRDVLY